MIDWILGMSKGKVSRTMPWFWKVHLLSWERWNKLGVKEGLIVHLKLVKC